MRRPAKSGKVVQPYRIFVPSGVQNASVGSIRTHVSMSRPYSGRSRGRMFDKGCGFRVQCPWARPWAQRGLNAIMRY